MRRPQLHGVLGNKNNATVAKHLWGTHSSSLDAFPRRRTSPSPAVVAFASKTDNYTGGASIPPSGESWTAAAYRSRCVASACDTVPATVQISCLAKRVRQAGPDVSARQQNCKRCPPQDTVTDQPSLDRARRLRGAICPSGDEVIRRVPVQRGSGLRADLPTPRGVHPPWSARRRRVARPLPKKPCAWAAARI
jgi:hypothetical protein